MIQTRTRVAAAIAALCLVGLSAGCSSSGDTATAVASSAAPDGSTTVPTASPVADASSVGRSAATDASATPATGAAAMPYDGPAVTLTIGTDDSPGVPNADEISHFVDTVKSLSGGKITVEPNWHADGDGHLDWDQQVAAMVQQGELDLALGPTWAWDVLGVKSFEPLQSPFLIDSDSLVAAVVSDSDLSGTLMAGLSDAGVVGIALWPEGLRHPFGFDGPLLAAEDYRGKTIRSPESAATTAIFKALGAKTTAEDPDATTMIGIQSEYAYSPNGAGTSNVTFFPKVNVLYANTDSYTELDSGAKKILTAAAAETQKWAIGRTDDAAAGKAFCDDDGTLVLASEDQLADLQFATKPVADTVKAAHPDVIAAIEGLKVSQSAPIYAATCAPAGAAPSTHAPGAAEAALNGTYRFTLTPKDFEAAGMASQIHNNAGVQTFTLKNGTVHSRLDPSEREFSPVAGPGGSADEADGTYQVDDDSVTFRFPSFENEVDRFTFTAAPDGGLTLKFVDSTNGPGIEFFMASKVWERIT